MIVGLHKKEHHLDELPLIVITGFMGTGKTETAKELSKLLGFEFIDTDVLVERLASRSISEIIAENGEAHFRALEAEACKQLYERRRTVIATGGGTLLNEEVFRTFARSGTIVLLEASVESLLERLTADKTRPLLLMDAQGESRKELRERIRSLLEEREKIYGKIPLRIDTSHITPHVAACRIAAKIALPSTAYCIGTSERLRLNKQVVGYISKKAPVNSQKASKRARDDHQVAAVNRFNPGRSRSIVEMGRGVLSIIGEKLKSHGLAENVILLMPPATREHFVHQIEASLVAAGISYHLIKTEDGEPHKTLSQAGHIIDRIAEIGAGRYATIVPVGGGVTGDVGAFVASIYMRGAHLVHVPTTLLAQVDSSIGGKTGVNHTRAKNLIGSFYQPDLVLTDPCVLRTLPLEQISGGMAEVIKTALLGSMELFEFIESALSGSGDSALRSMDFLERCVSDCIAIKGSIVEEDPFENDKRRILNLGHTVGHALEAACEYKIGHGQAVALGLVAACKIAVARGMVERNLLRRTTTILEKCRLPVVFPHFKEETFFKSLQLDKKRIERRMHFVLPLSPWGVQVTDDVKADEIMAAISEGRK